ncbi:MAG: YwaF family protein [Oscillospiraceae bacterium]|nr:YwaF family protein [Oscillospiraceae bacterium]
MELWAPEHIQTLLPALGIMILISVVFRLVLGNKSLKVRMIPIQVIACLLLLLEIGKQIVSWKQGYDLYHLPFHFCSLFLLVLPLMAFYRGKRRSAVNAISAAVCTSLLLLMLIYPNLIYSGGNIQNFFKHYLDFHTVAFHNLVMLASFLVIALQLHDPQPKGEPKAILLFTAGFCTVSASMAHILKTNYANYYTCNIPPLEAIRVSLQDILGYGVTQILYVLIVSLLNLGFVLMCYYLYKLLSKLVRGRKVQTVSTT